MSAAPKVFMGPIKTLLSTMAARLAANGTEVGHRLDRGDWGEAGGD